MDGSRSSNAAPHFPGSTSRATDQNTLERGNNKSVPQLDQTRQHAPPSNTSAPPSNPAYQTKPTELRYEIARYAPTEGYYDCDLFISRHRDCGVGPTFRNCFGCGRTKQDPEHVNPADKISCPGFPACPTWILCIFCGQQCGNHDQSFCPARWATTNFLRRRAALDSRAPHPTRLQVKPNAEEANFLANQNLLKITTYTDSIHVQRDHFTWLSPPRQPRIAIRDFANTTKGQRTRMMKEMAKEADVRGLRKPRNGPNTTMRPQPQPQPLVSTRDRVLGRQPDNNRPRQQWSKEWLASQIGTEHGSQKHQQERNDDNSRKRQREDDKDGSRKRQREDDGDGSRKRQRGYDAGTPQSAFTPQDSLRPEPAQSDYHTSSRQQHDQSVPGPFARRELAQPNHDASISQQQATPNIGTGFNGLQIMGATTRSLNSMNNSHSNYSRDGHFNNHGRGRGRGSGRGSSQ